MTEEAGKGFVRRVTKLTLKNFAPLLRDLTNEPTTSTEITSSGSPIGSGTNELAAVQALFNGSKVQVHLSFTFPWGELVPKAETPSSIDEMETPDTQNDVSFHPTDNVLVSEIGGPGRWSQASFSKKIFDEFFGAGQIHLTHINADGTVTSEIANPIVKESSNYCYELGAAANRNYPPLTDGRPIGVFLSLEEQQFQYQLVMPSDPDHAILDGLLAAHWKGSARLMRRVTIDLQTLLNAWPTAPFLSIALGTVVK